jgi:hypothetical protein
VIKIEGWVLPERDGELTVEQMFDDDGEGWIVLEDGKRVGGTLRYPFPTREAAERWVRKETEGRDQTSPDRRAIARVIRETDPELWATYERIEKQCTPENRQAAHAKAGTAKLCIRIGLAALKAKGKVDCTSDGLWFLTDLGNRKIGNDE